MKTGMYREATTNLDTIAGDADLILMDAALRPRRARATALCRL